MGVIFIITLYANIIIFVKVFIMEKKDVKLEFIDKSEKVALYTICFKGNDTSEFADFMLKYKNNADLKQDYRYIVYALSKILENGALERYFRPEGKIKDNLSALPIEHGKLRLYCLRISDQILILGNGGVKRTKKYNEDEELSGYVISLQKFDEILRGEIMKGSITIEHTSIEGIDDKYFRL